MSAPCASAPRGPDYEPDGPPLGSRVSTRVTRSDSPADVHAQSADVPVHLLPEVADLAVHFRPEATDLLVHFRPEVADLSLYADELPVDRREPDHAAPKERSEHADENSLRPGQRFAGTLGTTSQMSRSAARHRSPLLST